MTSDRERVLDELEVLVTVGLVLTALRGNFELDTVTGAFRTIAVSAMMTQEDSNRLLVQRGLLPPFTVS